MQAWPNKVAGVGHGAVMIGAGGGCLIQHEKHELQASLLFVCGGLLIICFRHIPSHWYGYCFFFNSGLTLAIVHHHRTTIAMATTTATAC